MDKPIPSEAVQVSAQIFALEMAKHLVTEKGVTATDARATAVKNTRKCMDNLGLTPTSHREGK